MMNINHCLTLLSDAMIFTFPKGVGRYTFVSNAVAAGQIVHLKQYQRSMSNQTQKNIFNLYEKQGIYYFKPVNGKRISEVNPVADQTKILRRD